MNVYFVYKVLTNRIRALIIAAGYIGNTYGKSKARFLGFSNFDGVI